MNVVGVAFLYYLILVSVPAQATLGEPVSSVEKDRTALQANNSRQSQAAAYSTRELQTPVNTVTEYINPSGAVFALSWHGVANPDLSQLLGSYFQEYKSGAAAQPVLHSRQPFTVKTTNLVLHSGGHMRDLRGLVFLPSQVPANVNPEQLP